MRRVAWSLCQLAAAAALHAGEAPGRWELGLNLGVAGYQGDVDKGEYTPCFDLRGHYRLSERWALGLVAGGTTLRAEEVNVGFQAPLTGIAGRARWQPWGERAVTPYLSAGLEWASFNVEDSEDEDSHPPYHDGSKISETTALAVPLGLGFAHRLSDNWVMNLEGVYHLSNSDWLDDMEANDDNDHWLTVSAGLAWSPGKVKARDTDGDGLPDKLDKCPTRPEDQDGFEDGDGCPDPDPHGDGVLDVNDKCPNDKEDVDGFQDADGCPDPDNDGDGILDARDKCPNDAEDREGFQDEDGCPDPDNDGDGILDTQDKCPNEAETVNGYRDEDGCPDKKPEVQVEQGKAIVLEGITFESGKTMLKPESEIPLGKVLRTLQENPEIEVEVRGHTDNQGMAEANRALSQRRADTVKAWLTERGIDAARIRTKGFGPDQPVADNATPEGRAQNRRIEFFRLK